MKTLIIALVILAAAAQSGYSQDVNWRTLQMDRPNRLQLNIGYDYAAVTQLSYSRAFDLSRPVVVGLHCSLPMGSQVVDDFVLRLGAQVEVARWRGFSATFKAASNFRRYQNDLVRMLSFGAEFSALIGYYDTDWHAAVELGFDKAVATRLTHSDVMKEYGYAGVRDGWYVPTGGNFSYGIQAGKTIGDYAEVTLRLGMTDAQFDDEDAMLPYYLQLGFGMPF
ncbi:MAG: hypothetical protein C0600_00840 [Ignavibacteria bacterium]|nr:MAG: hypothetical protein C0600_00840 [Ignavibacteria bacterium]